jgi:lipoate-protein ligase A
VIKSIGEEKQKIKDIVRRPTGGGIVFHKTDLTFSFIFHSPGIFKPVQTYRRLHDSINMEYLKSGFLFELLDKKDCNYDIRKNCNYNINNPVMDCFSKPVPMDILYNGKKIFGGALRKFDNYMLYQASIQIENARDKCNFHSERIANALSKEFEINWTSFDVSQSQSEKIKELSVLKYKTVEWNERI